VEGAVSETRAFLRESLTAPMMLCADGPVYRFTGELAVGELLAGELGLACESPSLG
jgi:hypothetical protein